MCSLIIGISSQAREGNKLDLAAKNFGTKVAGEMRNFSERTAGRQCD
jgi:hypothetical protein